MSTIGSIPIYLADHYPVAWEANGNATRAARFKAFDMEDSVPAQTVRVDNVDQVIVDIGRIDKAALPAMDRLTDAFRSMIRIAGDNVVLVAAMLNKRQAEQELRAIEFLQTEGFTVG